MECIADGLHFPEGPVVMADGSVIVVEIEGRRITRCWNGRKETICETGGGPNGAAIGPDGALWICNSGGGMSEPTSAGRIERLDLATGKLERIYESCDDIDLSAPNDLVFDSSGRLWFTDFGSYTMSEDGMSAKDCGGLYSCTADGASITVLKRAALSYNGIGLSPDEQYVYVADTLSARVYRYDARPERQKPDYVGTALGDLGFDSLAVTAAGNVCVATVFQGGIATVTPDGKVTHLPLPDEYVTNIAFGGEDMRDAYITLSASGQLVRVRWDEPGLKLAFNG